LGVEEQLPSYAARITRALIRPRSIRARLSRILLVTVLLVLVMLALIVSERMETYRSATATARVVTVALKVQDLMHELQRERGMTYGLLGGGRFYASALDAQRMRTDIARADLDAALSDPANAGKAADEVRGALGKLQDLAGIRGRVDAGQAAATDVFFFYTTASRALTDLQLGLDGAGDPQLRNGLQALYALSDVKDYADWTRGLLNGVFTANSITPEQYTQLSQVRADQQSALQIYNHFATASQQQAVTAVLHAPPATAAATAEGVALSALDGHLGQHVDAQVHWWNQMTLLINSLRDVQLESVSADLDARADQLRTSALSGLILFALLAAVAIAVVGALVIEAALSIIGPLRLLASEANTIATDRLPSAVAAMEQASEQEIHRPRDIPIAVSDGTSSEIRLMARAVGRLQHTALSLAGEQAMIRHNTTTSLANLGRRNQNLVRRQLSLISDFEREELDPAMLANMFELDHLATRMRRNAESLLVLVGESSPRAWVKPLPVVDVVRAALSEVEDYRRVELKRIDDVYLPGAAATDLAHMLAELIENGLAFSPPDAEVEVFGRRMGSRYTIAIVDHGAGMQPDALARANARLHDEENFLVAPTRFLGHYVVGRLAKRLGVDVRLVPAPVTGITARLVLPESLLVEKDDWPTADVTPPSALVDQPTEKLSATSEGTDQDDSSSEENPQPEPRPAGTLSRPEPVPAPQLTAPEPVPAPQLTAPEPVPAPQLTAPEPVPAPSGSRPEAVLPGSRPEAVPSTPGTWVEPEPAVAAGSAQPVEVTATPTPTPAQQAVPDPPARSERPGGAPSAQRVRVDLGAERTRNGLVKRQPRGERPRQPRPQAPASRPAPQSAQRERTPNEVGAMLSSYRTGHQRGTTGMQWNRPPMVASAGGPPRTTPTGPDPTSPRPPRPGPAPSAPRPPRPGPVPDRRAFSPTPPPVPPSSPTDWNAGRGSANPDPISPDHDARDHGTDAPQRDAPPEAQPEPGQAGPGRERQVPMTSQGEPE
jgi:hypothetical protein